MTTPTLPIHPVLVARNQLFLSTDAYLRALPFVVEIELRLRLDAIVFAADTIATAYGRLFDLALELGCHQVNATVAKDPYGRTTLFQQAWSIVDQVHNLRKLLVPLGSVIAGIDPFIANFENAKNLRNRMDHLGSLIPNIAKSKSSAASLYGSLSYLLALQPVAPLNSEEYAKPVTYMVVQQAGPVRPGQEVGAMTIPSVARFPAGNFCLRAFEWSLDLDEVILQLAPLINAINDRVKNDITSQIVQKAAELGKSKQELSQHFGANFCFMLAFKMDAEPETVPLPE